MSRPATATASPCSATACAGPMPSCWRRPTASRTCWCRTWAWCPATACCCAAPMRRCWRPAGWRWSRPAASRWAPCRCCARASCSPSSTRRRSRMRCATRAWPTSWQAARPQCPTLQHVVFYGGDLEARAAAKPAHFDTVDTAADDVALIAFTSGTTGVPKGTMHFHRDVMAACACWPPHVLRPRATTSSSAARRWPSPSGWAGCCCSRCPSARPTVLLEKASARRAAAGDRAVTAPPCCFTAPTSYRAMAAHSAPAGAARPGQPAQVRLGRRGAAGRDARAVEAGHRHRDHRRHRLHRDVPHLHLRRRGPREARRHRRARARLPRRGAGRRRPAAAARPGGAARGAGPHRLQVPGRPAPGAVRAAAAGTSPATPTWSTPTATSSTRRAPTT